MTTTTTTTTTTRGCACSFTRHFDFQAGLLRYEEATVLRKYRKEQTNFSIMDAKLEDFEGPFSLAFTAILILSRLIRSNQDAEKPAYDN